MKKKTNEIASFPVWFSNIVYIFKKGVTSRVEQDLCVFLSTLFLFVKSLFIAYPYFVYCNSLESMFKLFGFN